MYINSLYPAAGLSGIEKCAVDQRLHRMRQIGIGSPIGRVVAAEFQTDTDETPNRCLFDCNTARNGTREANEVHLGRANNPAGVVMCRMQKLKPAVRKAAANRSATSGVCAECLSNTVLPASNAGTMALTAVSNG